MRAHLSSGCPACGVPYELTLAQGQRAPHELAAEADRIYFERHPDETERIRAAFCGEFCACVFWVRVTEIEPGVRLREAWT